MNMPASRSFHLGDVLSITTGILLSPRRIEGIYDILNFMTGDSLYTHQLPRVSKEARPFLIEQHPWLADIDSTGCDAETYEAMMAGWIAKHGETVSVQPMPKDAHERIDPLSELAESIHPEKIIVVKG